MDRMLYVAMSGANSALQAQVHNANNLSNASTPGFQADLAAIQGVGLKGGSRTSVRLDNVGTDFRIGSIQSTGNDLDVAVSNGGWLVVQTPEGGEGLTRRGDLRVSPLGLMTNGAGQPVMGENGPISIPPFASLEMAADGTISIVPVGQDATSQSVVDRLKLVSVDDPGQLRKGLDGLLRMQDGEELVSDSTVRVIPGALENSNVNTVEAMVKMIELSRSFETQTKLMRMASDNDRASAELMKMS